MNLAPSTVKTFQKGLWILLFLMYLAKALYMGEIMKDKLHK